MRRIYWVWAAGLLLKLLGASWDVAWHFRFLRETFSPPHVVNLLGELLVAGALVHEFRNLEKHRRAPLLVVLAGVGLFLLAIPLDQWWHVTFGIDLTTWSPSHLMLFYGTAVGVAGITLLFLADLRHEHRSVTGANPTERALLAFFLILFAEALAFPLTFNEYTTTSVIGVCQGNTALDPVLIASAKLYSAQCTDLNAAIFHGTPTWLYPVYAIGFSIFLATIVRASIGPGWALLTLAGLSIERAIADLALSGLGWPAAVIPFQYIAIGLCIEAVWMLPLHARSRALGGAMMSVLGGYVYFVSATVASAQPGWPPAVPLDGSSLPLGIAVTTLLAWGAFELQVRSEPLANRVNEGPEWDRVTDWAREKWDALRS